MLRNIFYAVLLGVGMAACLSQNSNEQVSETELMPDTAAALTEEDETVALSPEHFIIKKGQVGNIRIGMPIDTFRTNVTQGFTIADTIINLEGQQATAYTLTAPEQTKGILIEQACEPACSVWRINVLNDEYQTSKGIGVGSKFGEVQQRYPIETVTLADGGLVAVSNNVGISFVLDTAQIPAPQRSNLNPNTVPANTLVKRILIY